MILEISQSLGTGRDPRRVIDRVMGFEEYLGAG
jgi:hypothetical protein